MEEGCVDVCWLRSSLTFRGCAAPPACACRRGGPSCRRTDPAAASFRPVCAAHSQRVSSCTYHFHPRAERTQPPARRQRRTPRREGHGRIGRGGRGGERAVQRGCCDVDARRPRWPGIAPRARPAQHLARFQSKREPTGKDRTENLLLAALLDDVRSSWNHISRRHHTLRAVVS